jgi:hypothetical protein
MRAAFIIAAFLLATLAATSAARAHVPLWAPRVSLSLALDWNKLARDAVTRPKPKPVKKVARHLIPRLTVTAAAPAPNQLDVYAYGRAETFARSVLTPSYVEPNPDHRQMFRQVYLFPYTPYLGAYGLILTVETNALLR